MSKTLADQIADAIDTLQDRAEREIEEERKHKPNAEKELRDAIKAERRALVRTIIDNHKNETSSKATSKTAREVIEGYEFERACGGGDEDYNATFELWDEDADKIITALDAAGFVIVPKEPTEAMLSAGEKPSSQFRDGTASEGGPRAWYLEPQQLSAIYRAMIAAAKESP